MARSGQLVAPTIATPRESCLPYSPMVSFGALVQQLGIVMFVAGFGLYLASIVYRMAMIFGVRVLQGEAFLIGFYARAAGMVGIMGSIVGSVMSGATPWPWLILVFIFGAPSLALLLVRPVREDPLKVDSSRWRRS
jgi:hypothetical protein